MLKRPGTPPPSTSSASPADDTLSGARRRPIARRSGGSKLRVLSEFWQFLRVRKKFWLAPIVLVLVLLGMLVWTVSGTALAPFVYALF